MRASAFLEGYDALRRVTAEPLEVERLDELRERRLPPLLSVIVELAELPRIHTQLTRDLHLRVREVMALPRCDPVLEAWRELALRQSAPQASPRQRR